MSRSAIAIVGLALVGCRGGGQSLMPLSVDHAWTYEVHGRRVGQVAEMRVNRRIAVDDVSGYEVTGPLGVDRLAWRGPQLIAETLCNTTFNPPIPLLDSRLPRSPVLWSGAVTAPASVVHATGTLTETATDTVFASHKTAAVKSVLQLNLGRRRLELDSWFVAGVGLVKQEERANDVETERVAMTGGP
ncbi:MAG: hypothetical protein ACYC96_04155 [Fimbriimonadaceae bacterium]